jgi:hypothetical protein
VFFFSLTDAFYIFSQLFSDFASENTELLAKEVSVMKNVSTPLATVRGLCITLYCWCLYFFLSFFAFAVSVISNPNEYHCGLLASFVFRVFLFTSEVAGIDFNKHNKNKMPKNAVYSLLTPKTEMLIRCVHCR